MGRHWRTPACQLCQRCVAISLQGKSRLHLSWRSTYLISSDHGEWASLRFGSVEDVIAVLVLLRRGLEGERIGSYQISDTPPTSDRY
jgi:hypothetical protein